MTADYAAMMSCKVYGLTIKDQHSTLNAYKDVKFSAVALKEKLKTLYKILERMVYRVSM